MGYYLLIRDAEGTAAGNRPIGAQLIRFHFHWEGWKRNEATLQPSWTLSKSNTPTHYFTEQRELHLLCDSGITRFYILDRI